MQMCPFCDKVYDESEYSHCPYCHPYDEDDGRERTVIVYDRDEGRAKYVPESEAEKYNYKDKQKKRLAAGAKSSGEAFLRLCGYACTSCPCLKVKRISSAL